MLTSLHSTKRHLCYFFAVGRRYGLRIEWDENTIWKKKKKFRKGQTCRSRWKEAGNINKGTRQPNVKLTNELIEDKKLRSWNNRNSYRHIYIYVLFFSSSFYPTDKLYLYLSSQNVIMKPVYLPSFLHSIHIDGLWKCALRG